MSTIQRSRLVSPKLPTVLTDQERVDLPGYDHWHHPVINVHVVQVKLDVLTFEEALSRALQLYPHAAGQLRCGGEMCSIELANTPVPLHIEYRLNMTSDALLDGDWVVQDDLTPFLSRQSISLFPAEADDAHLLCLKLTLFENEMAVGISWHHALGDAILLSRFTHALSQFYQGLPLRHPPPTFKKYCFPTPSASMKAEFLPRLPHLHLTYPLESFGAIYDDYVKIFQDAKWRFEDHDIVELRSALSPHNSYLSKQDCLSAYIVAALNENMSEPVQVVTNVSSYRNVSASFIAENTAGNMIQNIPATVPPDLAGIAVALRRALQQCKEAEYVYNLMTVASDKIRKISHAGMIFHTYLCDDTIVWVDSNLVIDWCSIHFGYPDGSRFYTTGSCKHWLRCFRSNPVKRDDGVWQSRQSVDVSMGVRVEQRSKLVETFSRGFGYMLDRTEQAKRRNE